MEKIQVVLASPSDLADERQMIKDLVNSLNPLYMKNGICIDLRMWENSTPGMNADGPQGLIDMDLEITNADLFICMYWKKIGTKLANEDVAGTEHELNLALDSYHKRRKPDIKAFFKVIDESEKNDDTRKISAISKKLQPLGLYTPFKDISELKDNVSKILQAEVMNLIRKQGQVMPEIHKYIEISDTNEFISNFSSNNKLVLNKGYYDPILNQVITCIDEFKHQDDLSILDLGCGEGYYTQGLKKHFENSDIYGLDISKIAIDMATRYRKDITWLVGNSKNIPILDHSLDFICALFTVVNQDELKRALKEDGYIVHVTANNQHLIEIKELIYDEIKVKSDKYIRLDFNQVKSYDFKEKVHISNREDALNLLMMTPHYYHIKKEKRGVLDTLQGLDITIDIKVTVYALS